MRLIIVQSYQFLLGNRNLVCRWCANCDKSIRIMINQHNLESRFDEVIINFGGLW